MKRHNSELCWLELHWRKSIEPDDAVILLERLATSAELGTIVLEVRAHKTSTNKSQLHWLVGISSGSTRTLEKLLVSLLPVRTTLLDQSTVSIRRKAVTAAGRLQLSKPALSLDTNRITAVARTLLAALGSIGEDESVVLQTILGGRLSPRLVDGQPEPTWFNLLLNNKPPISSSDSSALKKRYAHHGFRAQIRLGVQTNSPIRDYQLIQQLFGALRVMEAAGSRLHLVKESPELLNQTQKPWRYGLALSTTELVGLIGLPVGELALPGLSEHPLLLAPKELLARTDRNFARLVLPGDDRKVGIPLMDSLYHAALLGPTGSGKSTAMLSLIEAAIHDGQGVLVIDPKTDLVNDVLARVPTNRQTDVVVIDPTSSAPVGLNPLKDSRRSPELVADSLLASFKQLFADSWGVRTEDILTAALLTLARKKDANLIWLPRLLSDAQFRHEVLAGIHDPLGVEDFWQRFESKRDAQRELEIQPVLNKLRQFMLRPAMRAVLGQTEPEFELSQLFTERKIILISLNKGILGAESARLLGSLIVGQLWPLILGRAKLPAIQRSVVGVFIDEVQDYLRLPVDLADALAQARSLHVSFCLAHQYRAQLSPEMRAAIDTNCHSKIMFGLTSADDARDMAKLSTKLEAQDFMLLPQYQVYANLMQAGKASGWISLKTLAPSLATSDPAELRALSEQHYGMPAKETEADLIELLQPNGTTTKASKLVKETPVGRRELS